ncbi:HET-domain-containing protein [Apiospora arundinis]|uniref:HET-domain-containing protein n=1 Tax=Apiospora arundinis TaxID=335852 RepID=A0ABR2JHX3_9PEZI
MGRRRGPQFGALPDEWKQKNIEHLHRMRGYEKISMCQNQALTEGIDWVWVDTCCIDKQSSAELSEAINSMYRWYKQSYICYAYLQDVSHLEEIEHSRWFTRGWTLQELLAPAEVVFYSQDWRCLGTKSSLGWRIEAVTGIELEYLNALFPHKANVSKKMSWAAERNTARVEDEAYSLLGLFDINMPLIYGEGKKAFKRFQEEILRRNPEDHTLFAWGEVIDVRFADLGKRVDEIPGFNEQMANGGTETRTHGLLASAPKDFINSRYIVNRQEPSLLPNRLGEDTSAEQKQPPSLAGEAVRIRFINVKDMIYPFRPNKHFPIVQQRPASLVWTHCVDSSADICQFSCLLTVPWGNVQTYATCPATRTRHLLRVTIPEHLFGSVLWKRKRLRSFDIFPARNWVHTNSVVVASLSYRGKSRYLTKYDFVLQGAHEVDYRTFKSVSEDDEDFSFRIHEIVPENTSSRGRTAGSITFYYRDCRLSIENVDWQSVMIEAVVERQTAIHVATEFQSRWKLENGVYA